MPTVAQGARPKPRVGELMLAGIGAAITGYWAWTYTGIYRWVAELQLRWFHEYEVQITFIVTLLIVCAPLVALSVLLRRALGLPAPGPRSGEALTGPTSPLGSAVATGGIIAAVGLGFVGFGAYTWHGAATAGAQVHATAADYEAGRAPAGAYAAVAGHALRDGAASLKSSDASAKYYIPLVSDDFTAGAGVAVYLETGEPNMMPSNQLDRVGSPGRAGEPTPEVWEGMLADGGLPGLIRTHFEQTSFTPAPHYRVLSVGETPEKAMSNGRVMMCIGGGVAVLGVVMGAFTGWRAGRGERAAMATAGPPADPRLQIRSIVEPTNVGDRPTDFGQRQK